MNSLGPFEILLGLVLGALFIAAFAFWIWALVDAIKVPNDSDYRAGTKIIWVLVVVLLGFIGAVIYVAVGRPQRLPA